jgi:hypothetical protein
MFRNKTPEPNADTTQDVILQCLCDDPQPCKYGATYGWPGENAKCCHIHVQSGMILYPQTLCEADNCTQAAIFGTLAPERCENHRLLYDENICYETNPPRVRSFEGGWWKYLTDLWQQHTSLWHTPPLTMNVTIDRKNLIDYPRELWYWTTDQMNVILWPQSFRSCEDSDEGDSLYMWRTTLSLQKPAIWIRYHGMEILNVFPRRREKIRTQTLLTAIGQSLMLASVPNTADYVRCLYLYYQSDDQAPNFHEKEFLAQMYSIPPPRC